MAAYMSTTSDDGIPTHSSSEQNQTEKVCRETFTDWLNPDDSLSRES